jgi:uncharacterized protein (DUF2384 family)
MYKYPQYMLLNRHLFALLGSYDLVNRWYESPNRAFNDQQPIDLITTSEETRKQVYKYVFNFCYR